LAESTRRRQAAMAKLAEIEVQQREGRLIEIQNAHDTWAEIMLTVRSMVLGLAGQICFEIPTLTPTEKETIARICRDALEDAAMGRGHAAIGRLEGESDASTTPTTAADEDDSLSYWSKRKERALAEKHELDQARPILRGGRNMPPSRARIFDHTRTTFKHRGQACRRPRAPESR
jgi:hypothetical protein